MLEFASNLIGPIIFLIAVLIIVIACVSVYIKVKKRLSKISKQFFNTTDIVQGIKQQQQKMSETPRSISSMTNVYLPLIHKDFPEFNYDEFKQKAEILLIDYFNAISTKKQIDNVNITDNVSMQVNGIIGQLISNSHTEYYESVVIHNTEITRYEKNDAICKIIFQTALENINYIVNEQGNIIFGDKNQKEQTIYETELVYIQEMNMNRYENLQRAHMLVCPNCGGAIKNQSAFFCEYCGCGIQQKNVFVWNFNSIKEVSGNKAH